MNQLVRRALMLLTCFVITAFGAIDYSAVIVPRNIRVYDFTIVLPAPTSNTDTVMVNAYFNALKYAPALIEYLSSKDTSRNCLFVDGCASTLLYTKSQAKTNVSTMEWMAANPPHAPSAAEMGNIHYYITGSIKPGVNGTQNVLSVTYKLCTRNGDSIASVSSSVPYDLPDVSLISQAGVDIQSSIGPLFDKVHSYEDKKMQENSAYGVNPTFTLTPAKRVLDLNEETTVKLKLTDFGSGLANRNVKVEQCPVGSFDKSVYTTDANGEATLRFKADGAQTGIGIISVSTEYLEPWCGISDAKETARGQTSITVNAPENTWEVSGSMRMNKFKTEETTASNYMQTSTSTMISDCQVAYLLKRQELPSQTVNKFYFIAQPGVVSSMYSGSSQESGSDESITSNIATSSHDESYFQASTTASPTGDANHEGINVNYNNFGFSFTKLAGKRSGESKSTQTLFVIGMGAPEVTKSTTKVDSSAAFNWAVQGVSRDTSYSIISGDGTSTKVTSITQKCSWDDSSSFTLSYSRRVSETSNQSIAGVASTSRSISMYRVEIIMFRHSGKSHINKPKQFTSRLIPAGGIQDRSLSVYYLQGRKFSHFSNTALTGKSMVHSGVYFILEKQNSSQRISPVLLVK